MINGVHLRDIILVCRHGKTIIQTACAVDPKSFHSSIGIYRSQGEPNAYLEAAEARGIVPESGVLIDDRPEAFASPISRLLSDSAAEEQLAVAARHAAEDQFSSDPLAARLSSAYTRVASPVGRQPDAGIPANAWQSRAGLRPHGVRQVLRAATSCRDCRVARQPEFSGESPATPVATERLPDVLLHSRDTLP